MADVGEVLQTERFRRSYECYSAGRVYVHRAFRRLVGIVETEAAWQERFKRVRGTRLPIYEQRVTSSDRLLFHWDSGPFTLVDVGPHEVTDAFSKLSPSEQTAIVERSEPALPEVVDVSALDPLFQSEGGLPRALFDDEDSPAWIHFLDEEQAQVRTDVTELVMDATDRSERLWVVGGAGTGKTSVLLNLLLDLGAYADCPVYWHSPKSVRDFLKHAALPGLDARTRDFADVPEGAVLLVDDPESVWDVKAAMQAAWKQKWRAVVVAFDPLQFPEKDSGEILKKLRADYAPIEKPLRRCYRQSGTVAGLAVDTSRRIHSMSGYRTDAARAAREREYWEPLIRMSLDEMRYSDDAGWTRTYESARHTDWAYEVSRLAARDDRWRDWPALLVVTDDQAKIELPAQWRRELKEASISARVQPLSQAATFRGQEFQETWLLLSQHLVESINTGVRGMPAETWKYMRGLHTAISRAKDGVVTFQGAPAR